MACFMGWGVRRNPYENFFPMELENLVYSVLDELQKLIFDGEQDLKRRPYIFGDEEKMLEIARLRELYRVEDLLKESVRL